MTDKVTPIEHALVSAAILGKLNYEQVLKLICENGQRLPDKNEGRKHFAKREKYVQQMQAACDRVLTHVKREVLRNLDKYFSDKVESAEGTPEAFDKDRFAKELDAALRAVQSQILVDAGSQLMEEIGSDSVWKVPDKLATAFFGTRANLMSEVPDEIHSTIMSTLKDGINSGESKAQLMARIESTFGEISTGRASTIANTETAAAFNFARDKAMRQAGITHKRWLHSQSPLIVEPRPTHIAADGQIRGIDEPFNVGGIKFMHPGDDSLGAGPEDIINCLPESAEVSFLDATKSFRRWFEGWMITIRLRSGRKISATPNHPALTTSGWIAYSELKQGDYLVSALPRNNLVGFQPHINNRPTTFGQIHDSWNLFRRNRILGVPADFHGDGFTGNVDIILSDRELMNGQQISILQQINHRSLELADTIKESLSSLGMIDEFSLGCFASTSCDLGERSESFSFSGVGTRHANKLRIGAVANLYPGSDQAWPKPCAGFPNSEGNGELALAALVGLDQILDVNAFRFRGFVHNLDTKRGYYLSNGIFHHNCHCVAIPTTA